MKTTTRMCALKVVSVCVMLSLYTFTAQALQLQYSSKTVAQCKSDISQSYRDFKGMIEAMATEVGVLQGMVQYIQDNDPGAWSGDHDLHAGEGLIQQLNDKEDETLAFLSELYSSSPIFMGVSSEICSPGNYNRLYEYYSRYMALSDNLKGKYPEAAQAGLDNPGTGFNSYIWDKIIRKIDEITTSGK